MIEFILVWEFFSDSEIRAFMSLDISSKLVIIFLFIIFVWKLWKDNYLIFLFFSISETAQDIFEFPILRPTLIIYLKLIIAFSLSLKSILLIVSISE